MARGRSTYEATCAAGPFVLSTRWTANLDLAVKYKQAERSRADRMSMDLLRNTVDG